MGKIMRDRDIYVPLQSDPRFSYNKQLEEIVNRGHDCGVLNKKEKAF